MRYFLFLCLLPFCFVSCTIPGESRNVLQDVVRGATEAAIVADTSGDGRVSNRELKDFGSNPINWITIIGSLLGAGAYAATRSQKKEVDELWATTHTPIKST